MVTAVSDDLLAQQARVLEQIVRGAPLEDVLANLCLIVEEHAGSPVRAAIMLCDDERKHLRMGAAPSLPASYNAAVDGVTIDREVATCSAAAARGEVVITPDIASAPGWVHFKELALPHGLVAAWSMPIMSSTKTVLGTFGTYFLEQRVPRPHERALVEVLSRTAGVAIERARADQVLRESAARHQFLAELEASTQVLTEPAEVLATTARFLAEHLDVDRCAYAEIEDERVAVVTGDYSRGVPSIVGRWKISAFGPELARAMAAGETYVVDDIEADPRIDAEFIPAYQAINIRAVMSVPLCKDGRFTEAIAVHQKVPRHWSAAEVELVSRVAARCWETLERVRMTRTLRESEARYRAIVETSPECVKLVDADGALLQMNDAGLRMIDAPDEQSVIGQCVYALVAPEHRDDYRRFNEYVCTGQRANIQFDMIAFDGTRRAMETAAVALPAPTGGFLQLGLTRDVSARVTAARALAESRARLDYAVRLSGVGFWYCDLPFDELVWDAQVREHFFIAPDFRVTIDDFYARIHRDDRELTRHAVERSIAEHMPYDVTFRTIAPTTGACKWIRALGGTSYADDGTAIRFDGVTVDVTAQKLDQERLARVAAAAFTIHSASSLEPLLQVVADEARTIIGAHQAGTILTNGSDAGQSITTESLSKYYARLGIAPSTSAGIDSLVFRTNRPLRLTQANIEANPEYRTLAGRDDSGPQLQGWLAVPLVAHDGTNIGIVQVSDKYEGDFTAADEAVLVQLAQLAAVAIENVRLYEQLRDQDRRKDEFLATLAHELRNPLAPIRTGLQILQQGEISPEREAKTRAIMERQLAHLVRMVDDLLDISRITLGKVTLKTERVDLRAVLDSALETTRPLVEAAGHELAIRLPSQPLPLSVDPTRLAQVFANLINNAVKFTPANGRIQITADEVDGILSVRITDSGVGIAQDMLPRVFEMFAQVGRSLDRSQGGLGIGLTLVRRLVEMHGGTIRADSPGIGKGSSFTVELPLVAERREPATVVPAARDSTATSAALRILVVDDNVDAAETLAALLELGGNDTRMAHDGPTAIDAAVEFCPDVMFLDIGLPGLNGYEVARNLRANTTLRQPVIVALTGWGTDDDRRQAQAAGFDRHLVKPIDAKRIDDVLASVRTGHGAASEAVPQSSHA